MHFYEGWKTYGDERRMANDPFVIGMGDLST